MLGKLLKYDLRSLSKVLLFVHLPLLALACIIRFFVIDRLFVHGPEFFTLSAIIVGFSYLVIVGFVTQIYYGLYVYRNLFTDQGYLTLTLPASANAHVLSKVLSGFIWISIDQIFIYASILIAFVTPKVIHIFSDNKEEFFKVMELTLGMSPEQFIFWVVVISILGGLFQAMLIVGCICVGQLFNKNRAVISIVVYFIYLTSMQLITILYSFYLSWYDKRMASSDTDAILFSNSYMSEIFMLSLVLTIAGGIVSYFLSVWIIKKKVNLH